MLLRTVPAASWARPCDVLGRGPALLGHGVLGVLRRRPHRLDGLLGRLAQVLLDLGRPPAGPPAAPSPAPPAWPGRRAPARGGGRQQRRHQPAGTERDEPGGQRVAAGLPPDRLRVPPARHPPPSTRRPGPCRRRTTPRPAPTRRPTRPCRTPGPSRSTRPTGRRRRRTRRTAWWPYGLLPMTFSFSRVAASRARSTRRSTILPGVTFSVRASTSWLSAAWVRSISRRICSGSLEVVTGVLLPRP